MTSGTGKNLKTIWISDFSHASKPSLVILRPLAYIYDTFTEKLNLHDSSKYI